MPATNLLVLINKIYYRLNLTSQKFSFISILQVKDNCVIPVSLLR